VYSFIAFFFRLSLGFCCAIGANRRSAGKCLPAVLSWVAVGINALFFYAIKTEAKKKPNPYMGNELETKKIFSRPQRHNFYKSFLLH
jgi:hypothetical protein